MNIAFSVVVCASLAVYLVAAVDDDGERSEGRGIPACAAASDQAAGHPEAAGHFEIPLPEDHIAPVPRIAGLEFGF